MCAARRRKRGVRRHDSTVDDDGGGRSQRSPERVARGERPGRRRAAGRARPHREPGRVDDRRASRRGPSRRSRRRNVEGTRERTRADDAEGRGASVRRVSRVVRPSRPPRDGVLRARPVRTFPPLRCPLCAKRTFARRPRLTPTRPLPTQATAWSSDPSYHPKGASPQSVQLALSREPVRPEASLFGGSPPRRSSRGLFPSSPSLATRRTAPFPADPAAGARGRATTRPLVSRALARRVPPPRTTRAGSSSARRAPSRARVPSPPRAPPPGVAERAHLLTLAGAVSTFEISRDSGGEAPWSFRYLHLRTRARFLASERTNRALADPLLTPPPPPLRPHVRVQRTTMAFLTRPRRCPRISPRSSSTRATPRPARQPPVPSGPGLAATRSRPWPPSPPGRASARRWRTTSSPRRNSAGRTRPRPRGNSPTLARARITTPRRRATTIVAEAGGAFARTAAAVPPRGRTRTRTRLRYRPARWRVRVPRVLEERARVWRRRSRQWLTRSGFPAAACNFA